MTAAPGRRRWRTVDLGLKRAYVEAEAPRVSCPTHGGWSLVAAVPWARHNAGHTRVFDDLAAWLFVRHTSKSAVEHLLRIAWRTVGGIVSGSEPTPPPKATGWAAFADRDR